MTLSSDSRILKAAVKHSFPETVNRSMDRSFDEPLSMSLPGTDCLLKSNVPLASLTTFRVGGPAEWLVTPRHLDEMQASLEWARSQQLPVTMLGAGSNLLISDNGLPGLVVSTRYLSTVQFDAATGQVTAGAGESIPKLAMALAKRGWAGFEWAVGIPGTVGGAVVMNAGAHSGCMADVLVNAEVLLPDGTTQLLLPEELDYRYRTSNLQGSNRLVTRATLQLQMGFDPGQVMEVTQNHRQQRLQSQPYDLPSCGSVFRNPTPYKAGWLIEQSGLKGYQIGGAQVAQRHANFILNCGGAKASDIFQLIRHVQTKVQQEWSLLLEPEVKMLGDFQSA